MSREVKIGLFAVISLAIAFLGYNFLKGEDLFSNKNMFYAEYDRIDNLLTSAPVSVKGLDVGSVKEIYLKPNDYNKIVVLFEINSDLKIPKNAVAEIFPTGFMGGVGIQLLFDKFCANDNCAQDGDKLEAANRSMLDSYLGKDNMRDYTGIVKDGLTGIVDTLSEQLKAEDNEVGQSMRDLAATLENMKVVTAQMSRMMAASQKNITQTMANMEGITANLQAQNAQIATILNNTATFTGQLNQMDLKKTNDDASAAMASLKTTLTSADKALSEISGLVANIKSGDGTLSKLIYQDDLHESIEETSFQLDKFLQDLRLNPKRYTRVLSRKNIPYTNPEDDPAVKEKN